MKAAIIRQYFDWSMYTQEFFHAALLARSPRTLDDLLDLWLKINLLHGSRRFIKGAFRTTLELMIRGKQLAVHTNAEGRCVVSAIDKLTASEPMATDIKGLEASAGGVL